MTSMRAKILVGFFAFGSFVTTMTVHAAQPLIAKIESGEATAPPSDLPGFRNFHEVSLGIYRSGRPTDENLDYLVEKLGVRTVLTLEYDKTYVAHLQTRAKELGIGVLWHSMTASDRPKDASINAILSELRDPSLRPILVHCEYGQDRTGLIVGLHRVLNEGVHPADAWDEMLHMGFNVQYRALIDYFEDRAGWDVPGLNPFETHGLRDPDLDAPR